MFTLDTMLEHHLQHNHYPPLPRMLVPVAKEAIEHGRDGDFDHEITMPTGLQFRRHDTVTVRNAIESMHLEGFLEITFDEEDES